MKSLTIAPSGQHWSEGVSRHVPAPAGPILARLGSFRFSALNCIAVRFPGETFIERNQSGMGGEFTACHPQS
jgi:hypothetical protein